MTTPTPALGAGGDGRVPPARVAFDIPAGDLGLALERLATQAGLQLLYPPDVVRGRRARALKGTLAPGEALRKLAGAAGLTVQVVNANTYVLGTRVAKARAAPAPARPKAPVHVPVPIPTVFVTGTHIPRSDIGTLTPSPVTLISREEIEASGHQTLFELLRTQPGMLGHHPVAVASDGGSGIQQPFAAAATTSLNALGPRATLFLVDGRRVANYGLISSELGGLADLDAIPLTIVERVEILRGGASATYGADAMAGVVNIILRKRQDGGEAVVRHGQSSRGDARESRLAVSHGFDTGPAGHAVLGMDVLQRDELLGAAREWRTMDLRRHGLGDRRIPLGYRDYDFNLVKRQCAHAPADVADDCLLDIPAYTSLQPSSRRWSLYGHVDRPLTDAIDLSVDLRAGHASQTLSNAPFHARVSLPENHPDHWPGADLDYAFFDIGPVRSHGDTRTLDGTVALSGWRGEWGWNASISHHRNRVDSRIEGLLRYTQFDRVTDAGGYRFDGTHNSPGLLASLSPPITVRGEATLQQAGFDVHGTWFSLPGGPVRVAAGLELLRDVLEHRPDPLMVDQDIALGPQKVPVDSQQRGGGVYAEVNLPFSPRLQMDVAARVDQREGYGRRWSPKIGIKWSPMDRLTLRAAGATGYRAPSLFETRRPSVVDELDLVRETPGLAPCAYVFAFGPDERYCLVGRSARDNPHLQPETSRSHTFGLVWAPAGHLSASVDYFRIRRSNEILPGSASDDPAAFPLSVVRDELGRLVGLDAYFANVGMTDVRGWELDLQGQWETARSGFTARLAAHYLDRLERESVPGAPRLDHAGYAAPTHSALASLQWRRSGWQATVSARALGPVQVGGPGAGCPRANREAGRCTTPARTTFDLDLAYTGWPDWRVALNIRDLGDRTPVDFEIDRGGYDIAQDDPRGRFLLLSLLRRF
ncbi:TonB-dependent receptor domain-containing protein [Lysobacter sp. A3-1-A15]|uniref:TonB-dependent receptor domain-containing protein n=1 Tax=Novilysobacter viscosus TaxID=3098602 RepID=UPI0039837B9E